MRSRIVFQKILVVLTVAVLIASPPSWASPSAAPTRQRRASKAAHRRSGGKAKKEKSEEKPKWDVNAPPGDWSTITIDTDETTWSEVDISPNGETLVFDMLGDLYTVPVAGGEAKALTESIAWDFQPRFSPDGTKIAFISDRGGADNLWIMNADGSNPRAVTEEKEHLVHNPSWNPDGEYMIVRQSDARYG